MLCFVCGPEVQYSVCRSFAESSEPSACKVNTVPFSRFTRTKNPKPEIVSPQKVLKVTVCRQSLTVALS